jgi:hypothetical protein
MQYDRTIVGYHGCTATTAGRILKGAPFSPSNNDYDWLGHGVYFWEHGPDRALRFIQEKLRREKRCDKPAVVGALLQLGLCFDLLDTKFTTGLAHDYPRFVTSLRAVGCTIPRNQGLAPDLKLRYLDCMMINWCLSGREADGLRYQTVRGCFVEGGLPFPARASKARATSRSPSVTQVASSEPSAPYSEPCREPKPNACLISTTWQAHALPSECAMRRPRSTSRASSVLAF